MPTIILAAAFWLVVTVHGEPRHQVGPMTAIEASGQRVVIAGRVVERKHVRVDCLPGERAT